MFDNYNYRRRDGRYQPITEIPGPTRAGGVGEVEGLRQRARQAEAEAAEWRELAKQWHTTAQQQQVALKKVEKEMAAANRQLAQLEKQLTAKRQTPPPAPSDEKNEWREKYLRLYADFENGKKRLEQRYALETQQNQEKLLRDMLPLADNLERALAHATDAEQRKGLEQIRRAFLAVLAGYGVETLRPVGRPFNPAQHEAIGAIANSDAESGVVLAVEETGYTYQDKLLRPARVLIAE
jgi:molecular chaperone GrpE